MRLYPGSVTQQRFGRITPQGQGTITYLDGHKWAGYRYKGEFAEGGPHGQGKWYNYCEGEWKLVYEGECQQGKYHGPGTMYENYDGADYRYEGEFVKDYPHGQGKWYRYCEGEWKLEYEGKCQWGEYHGPGAMTYLDGEWAGCRYEGEFANSKPHGQGILYNPDGTTRHRGPWADGKSIDDNAAP